ncbi:hypothetical protein MBLNU230_g4202t1 [Neophaeotheca triangularis]
MPHTKPNGVHIADTGKKTFIPLENNPKIFTTLAHNLGLSSRLRFYDVYSLDDPDPLSPIPRPVHALVFISPETIHHSVRATDKGSADLYYDGHGPDEPVTWFRQIIGHSCGLVALMHSIANGSARAFIHPGSLIDSLLRETEPLKPLPRAAVLGDSQALEDAHMAVATKGDSTAPSSTEPCPNHFVSFVKGADGRCMYELEGGWGGPIERGGLAAEEDMLSPRALEFGVERYLRVAREMGNVEFSIIALAMEPEA